MNLINVLLLSLAAAFLIIGIHQTMVWGIAHSYWILMLSTALLLYYKLRNKKTTPNG